MSYDLTNPEEASILVHLLQAENKRLREAATAVLQAHALLRYRRAPVMTPRQHELAKAADMTLRDLRAVLAPGRETE